MASEIQYNITLQVSKNSINVSGSVSKSIDMAGAEMIAATQSLTTSEAAVNFGGCDQRQKVLIKNLSDTESVKLGLDNPITQVVGILEPGGGTLLSQIPAIYAKTLANTGDIWVVAVED